MLIQEDADRLAGRLNALMNDKAAIDEEIKKIKETVRTNWTDGEKKVVTKFGSFVKYEMFSSWGWPRHLADAMEKAIADGTAKKMTTETIAFRDRNK